ncbi:winged helix-turn-helix domain-containing protein [Diaphorobacter caeni]|uniref:winged helix-turn-helix domain-containing protein n=1 Tax=Diaphorobacter caeni TaxID=2784387 RepID=UPI00188FB611|nr:response regulator transcription factor [Diaphorobacter caeni]MBF5007328.1 response regulator transcription factor [Diaphorobacter caeni]
MRILVVEDEVRLGQFVQQGMSECCYASDVVRNCSDASDALAETPYDAVILDLGLPDGDGLDLLKLWRQSGFNEPVLILSARDSMGDRVTGLDLGADDYLPKPFALEELQARIRSLLRRQSAVKQAVLQRGGLQLDLVAHKVFLDGQTIDLTSREYALLEIFMQNPGRILPRTLIAEKIWSSTYDADTNLLDVYMSRLRAKLETPGTPRFKTVRGIGYQLI